MKTEVKTEIPNLTQRLVSIMEEAGTINKQGRNEFSGYSYVRETDVAQKLQELLVKHRVFLFSSVLEVSSQQVMSSQGKPNIFSSVKVLYTFVNCDNQEDKFEVMAVGDGMDTGDKAVYKALTGAHKYLLIRNFNLGSIDDAETASPEIGKPTIASKQSGGFQF